MIYYEDHQIKIRDVLDSDVVYLFSWSIDKETNLHDPRPLPTNSDELIMECQEYCKLFEEEIKTKTKYHYFIITNKDNIPIGFVNIFSINEEKQNGEMGVCMGDKRYLHQGIATTAINFVVNYLFKNMNLKQIYLETGVDNLNAINLAKKCGFHYAREILDEGCRFIVMEIHQ